MDLGGGEAGCDGGRGGQEGGQWHQCIDYDDIAMSS